MYQCVCNITNKKEIAIFSSIIYLIVPYKLGDVYVRYAIGEFTAFIFIPILFIGIYNLFNQDGKKHYYIAIATICLILTHTVTTLYTGIFCIIYVVFNIKKLKEKEVIKKLIINVVFILLISMFFIMPLFEAMKSAEYAIFDNQIMSTNGAYVYKNTIKINEFFTYNRQKTGTICIIGIPIFVFTCLTIFTYKNIDIKYKNFFIISLLFSFISLYASTKYCPWFIFPNFLCKLQYPWRMLTFFAFFISFVVGVNIYVLLKTLFSKDITRLTIAVLLIITILAYTMPILLQYETDNVLIDKEQETAVLKNPYISHFSINREYLPIKALLIQRTYLEEKEDRIYILEGNAQILAENKQNLTDTAIIKEGTKNSIIEFPFFYYPGYKIMIEQNGQKEELGTIETDNGFVGTVLTKDVVEAKITVEYKGTTITYVSYIVSFISFIIFVIYCYKEYKNNN